MYCKQFYDQNLNSNNYTQVSKLRMITRDYKIFIPADWTRKHRLKKRLITNNIVLTIFWIIINNNTELTLDLVLSRYGVSTNLHHQSVSSSKSMKNCINKKGHNKKFHISIEWKIANMKRSQGTGWLNVTSNQNIPCNPSAGTDNVSV